MQSNQEDIRKDRNRLPIPLSATLTEVKKTAELIHAEVEEVSDLLHHRLTLKDNGLAHLVLQNLLYQLLDCMRQVMGVDTIAVLLQTKDSQQLAVYATLGLEEEITTGIRIPIGRGFAGRIAASCQPVLVDDLSTVEVVSPILRNKGLKSMLGVPLLLKNRVIGVFHVGTVRSRQFTKKDAQLLQLVADHIGLLIEHLIISSFCIAKCLKLVQEKFGLYQVAVKNVEQASRLLGEQAGRMPALRLTFECDLVLFGSLQKLSQIARDFDFHLLQKLNRKCVREFCAS